jgi:putative ABC transport system permease protein
MKLIFKLLWGQVFYRPARFVLTALAIVAAAGVVIWVVSGYDALVAQFDDFAEEYLGRHQFVVVPSAPVSGTSSSFPELSKAIISEVAQDPAIKAIDAETHVRITMTKVSASGDGKSEGGRDPNRRRRGLGGGGGPGGDRTPKNGIETASGNAPAAMSNQIAGVGPTATSASGRTAGPGFGPGTGRFGAPQSPVLIGTNAVESPYPIVEGQWISPSGTQLEAAISKRTADDFHVQVGDKIKVVFNKEILEIPIVGLVQQVRGIGGERGVSGAARGPSTSALYVPISIAEKLQSKPASISFARILLKDDAEPSEFRARWANKLAQSTPSIAILSADDVESDLETNRTASSARNQAYSATGIALLAALFIIFTALSMGVHERSRQFAVLRSVVLTPGQIGILILLESVLLGIVGWVGGLAAGWGLLKIMSIVQPTLFTSGTTLGTYCIVLSGVCAFGGSLTAAILPAWRAMHISPLDAMSLPSLSLSARSFNLMTCMGFLLILVNPLMVFALPMQDDSRYPIYVAIGCSTMAIGFILLTPMAILLAERILAPVISRILRLDPRLLANELSANLWRTVGTCVALTLGLGLFVATQIWGYSMLQPFIPGKWVPDLLVSFTLGGLPDEEFANVANVAGIDTNSCLPLAVEQPKLAEDYTHSTERASSVRQDTVIMIGVDPEKGIAQKDPLLKLKFVEGDAKSAAEKMKSGRACIVPDHFARETGLGMGDKFSALPPDKPEQQVEYTIAGIIELPGWHWMTKFSGLRRRNGRSSAIVFADFNVVRQDYALDRINFFWTALKPGAKLDEVGPAMQVIADRYPGERQPTNFQGLWTFGAMNYGSNIRLSTPEEVINRISVRSSGMIWGMCQLPLVTLAISGLGVLNTIMASIRARMWNIGVMRAVGLTGFSLARLILAESMLLGTVACVLSLAFGTMAGWCGAGISQYVSFFGGLNPSLVIPWGQLLIGFTLTLIVCIFAALWPALRVSRTEPLQLLQAGRDSM